jgi:hypothetical protein
VTEWKHRRLSEEEYKALFEEPMENVTASGGAALDTWPYLDSLESAELGGFTIHDVSSVYSHPNGRIEHVIIDRCAEDMHLIIIVDRQEKASSAIISSICGRSTT